MKSKLQTHIDNIKAYEMGEIYVDIIVERVTEMVMGGSLVAAVKKMLPVGGPMFKFKPGGYLPLPDEQEEFLPPSKNPLYPRTHKYAGELEPIYNPPEWIFEITSDAWEKMRDSL